MSLSLITNQANFKTCIIIGSTIASIILRHKVYDIYDCLIDNLTNIISLEFKIICAKNPRITYAIKNELMNKLDKKYCNMVTDSITEPEYVLSPGRYFIGNDIGYVYIKYQEETISLKLIPYVSTYLNYSKTRIYELFKDYINDIYKNYCSSCKMLIYFTSLSDRWTSPIIRVPRNIDDSTITKDMRILLDDVHIFKSDENFYKSKGIPYRRGYLLYGDSGTGKSSCVEIIAKTYGMVIHLLNINARDMTDTILINLLSKVPENSIICIEEIEKQLETLKRNQNVNVSIGGILTALDGPQRLSHSTIIILTSNMRTFLNENDEKALFREGRIDKIYEFTTKIKFV